MIMDAVPAPAQETLNSTGAQGLTNAAWLDKGKTCLGRLRWVLAKDRSIIATASS